MNAYGVKTVLFGLILALLAVGAGSQLPSGLGIALVVASLAVLVGGGFWLGSMPRKHWYELQAVAPSEITKGIDSVDPLRAAKELAVALSETLLRERTEVGKDLANARFTAEAYREKLNKLPTPVMEIDKDFNITFMNEVGASLNGLQPKDVVGTKCYKHFNTKHCQTPNCVLFRAMKSGKPENAETRANLKVGNANVPIFYSGIPTRNEKGEVTGALEFVMDNSATYGVVDELLAVSKTLGRSADGISGQSQQTAAIAEELSSQASTVAAASEEMSSGVSTVASAIEEMSASLQEVARNTERASHVADKAAANSDAVDTMMVQLERAAKEIGKVVEVISDIADQTNLLALNATIEAASAGEAGKGFAVVATEVKELAKQTARSTEEISEKVSSMQQQTTDAVKEIRQVSGIVREISGITAQIALAVQEQTATTGEIAANVSGLSTAAEDVSRNLQGVSQATEETSRSAISLERAAEQLNALSNKLQQTMSGFKNR